MLTHKVTYLDLNGVEVTEELQFHISRAELVDLDAEFEGGFEGFEPKRLSEALVPLKHLILAGYGKKSADGRSFEKDPEETKRFSQSLAFAQVFDDLADGDNEFFKAFFGGMMPEGFIKEFTILENEGKAPDPVPTLPPPTESGV